MTPNAPIFRYSIYNAASKIVQGPQNEKDAPLTGATPHT